MSPLFAMALGDWRSKASGRSPLIKVDLTSQFDSLLTWTAVDWHYEMTTFWVDLYITLILAIYAHLNFEKTQSWIIMIIEVLQLRSFGRTYSQKTQICQVGFYSCLFQDTCDEHYIYIYHNITSPSLGILGMSHDRTMAPCASFPIVFQCAQ